MKNKVRAIIYVILSLGIGIVSSYILNTYIVPALDGDTLEMLAQIFYSQDVEQLGLEATIQQKYTHVANILGVVLVIIFGITDLDEGVMGGIAWCGVHTCWHALKLYIWGIKLGKSVGDVESFKLALDIINFHPIRLVLIYLLYSAIIAGIIENLQLILCPIDSDKNNKSSSNKEQNVNSSNETKKVSLEKKDK